MTTIIIKRIIIVIIMIIKEEEEEEEEALTVAAQDQPALTNYVRARMTCCKLIPCVGTKRMQEET